MTCGFNPRVPASKLACVAERRLVDLNLQRDHLQATRSPPAKGISGGVPGVVGPPRDSIRRALLVGLRAPRGAFSSVADATLARPMVVPWAEAARLPSSHRCAVSPKAQTPASSRTTI